MIGNIPHNFDPRIYQYDLLDAFHSGYKRLAFSWHRRAGKDKTCLAGIVAPSMFNRVGSYYYCFPTYTQGKKAMWLNRDKNGFRTIEHIPKELWKRVDNSAMLIEVDSGSIFQVIGTENIDSIVGSNPVGIVYSEYSLQNPRAWDLIRPILAENGGWAIFNFTPRGENHAYELIEYAKESDQWFSQILTVDDTKAISPEVLASERAEMNARYGDDSLFLQEYHCSFNAPIVGAYYADVVSDAILAGRVVDDIPVYSELPVYAAFDIGVDDATSIWLFQYVSGGFHFIDFLEAQGEGLPYFVREMRERSIERKFIYKTIFMPHDVAVREWGGGAVSRKDMMFNYGFEDVDPVERPNDNIAVHAGIEAGRILFPRCWFDKKRCKKGLNALKSYSKKYDEQDMVYRKSPNHNWASHGADSFRTFACGWSERMPTTVGQGGWKQDPYTNILTQ